MSVFSKIKMSRKAAKEHKDKAAEKGKETNTAEKVPYKHIPTHAAVDALSGAPSSWKQTDRPKIIEHHQRRNRMAISRTASTLSTVSCMNPSLIHVAGEGSNAGATPPLMRNNSYSYSYSYNNPTWLDRTGDVGYSTEPLPKRLKPSRGHSYHDSGIGASLGSSPLASNIHSEEVSPVPSSGNSASSVSSENTELSQATKLHVQRIQPNVYTEKDIFNYLHTSTTRKLGEAPIAEHPPVAVKVPAATISAVAHDQKQKKYRWSLRGKRNTAVIAA